MIKTKLLISAAVTGQHSMSSKHNREKKLCEKNNKENILQYLPTQALSRV